MTIISVPWIGLALIAAGHAIALDLADMLRLTPGKMAQGPDLPEEKRVKIYFGRNKTVTKVNQQQKRQTGRWKLITNGQLCIKWESEKDFRCVFLVPMQTGTYQAYSRDNTLIAKFD